MSEEFQTGFKSYFKTSIVVVTLFPWRFPTFSSGFCPHFLLLDFPSLFFLAVVCLCENFPFFPKGWAKTEEVTRTCRMSAPSTFPDSGESRPGPRVATAATLWKLLSFKTIYLRYIFPRTTRDARDATMDIYRVTLSMESKVDLLTQLWKSI